MAGTSRIAKSGHESSHEDPFTSAKTSSPDHLSLHHHHHQPSLPTRTACLLRISRPFVSPFVPPIASRLFLGIGTNTNTAHTYPLVVVTSEAMASPTVFPQSHVGFDSITSQIERKLLKRGFQFNVICVGESTSCSLRTPGHPMADFRPGISALPCHQQLTRFVPNLQARPVWASRLSSTPSSPLTLSTRKAE